MIIKKFGRILLCIAIAAAAGTAANAQTWNSNAGGYNTGYGTVYGSLGLATATQNLYNSMQWSMQRAMTRASMIKQFGKAAVERSEREAAAGKRTSGSAASSGPAVEAPLPAPKYHGKFRPDASVDTGKQIADALGETPDEKKLYKHIFDATKASFEKEAAAKGWMNNIAGAMTFFLVANATVYHGSEEPSNEVTAAIYDAVNRSIDDVPEFAAASNKDKQALYNLLIGFAGIPLATLMEGAESGDAATVKVARQLAGEMIKIVLKTDPDKVRLDGGTMTIEK